MTAITTSNSIKVNPSRCRVSPRDNLGVKLRSSVLSGRVWTRNSREFVPIAHQSIFKKYLPRWTSVSELSEGGFVFGTINSGRGMTPLIGRVEGVSGHQEQQNDSRKNETIFGNPRIHRAAPKEASQIHYCKKRMQSEQRGQREEIINRSRCRVNDRDIGP